MDFFIVPLSNKGKGDVFKIEKKRKRKRRNVSGKLERELNW